MHKYKGHLLNKDHFLNSEILLFLLLTFLMLYQHILSSLLLCMIFTRHPLMNPQNLELLMPWSVLIWLQTDYSYRDMTNGGGWCVFVKSVRCHENFSTFFKSHLKDPTTLKRWPLWVHRPCQEILNYDCSLIKPPNSLSNPILITPLFR